MMETGSMYFEMGHFFKASQTEAIINIHLSWRLPLTSSGVNCSLSGGSISLGHDTPELSEVLLSKRSYNVSQSPKVCLVWFCPKTKAFALSLASDLPPPPHPPNLAPTLKNKAFYHLGVAKMVGNESSQVNRVHTHRSTRFQLSSLRRNILSLCRSRGIGESSAGVCELCNYQASAGSVLPRKHPIIRHCRLSLC